MRRLTVAVVVNDRQVSERSKARPAEWRPRSTDELHNLSVLAQAAVGFDSARGDVVSVQNISFDDNLARDGRSLPSRVYSAVQTSPEIVKYVSLIVLSLLLILFGVRPVLRQAIALTGHDASRLAAGPETATPLLRQPPQAALPDAERARAQEIFDKVSSQIRNEPAQSTRLLQSWIRSE